jgi:hypothetical protein
MHSETGLVPAAVSVDDESVVTGSDHAGRKAAAGHFSRSGERNSGANREALPSIRCAHNGHPPGPPC